MSGKITDRIRSDYFLGSRFGEYRHMLETFKEHGYTFLTVEQLAGRFLAGSSPQGRVCVLRHDIDTDPGAVPHFLDVEKALGIVSSYYFRLCTWNDRLVALATAAGAEVSYHFEELAQIAKRSVWQSAGDAVSGMAHSRQAFLENLTSLRRRSGNPIKTVASHGDWINRKLGIANQMILEDEDFRNECGIICEAYDPWYQALPDSNFSDDWWPELWKWSSPERALADGARTVFILVHPRRWRSAALANTGESLGRVVEGLQYSLKSRLLAGSLSGRG
ncbi:MAG: hypothetical protein WCQ50_03195 [Spirochaetota bacterium]